MRRKGFRIYNLLQRRLQVARIASRASCDVQHGTRCVSNAACVVQRATCNVCLTHIVVNTAGVASDFQNFELQAAAFALALQLF